MEQCVTIRAQDPAHSGTEIVLFPVEHVYDYSAAKVDRIYCTGFGSPYEYSHEMGHMVVSTARIVNGWSASCGQ